MLIVVGIMMSLVLALALLYFMFIQTSPSAILDLGFVSYLAGNAGTALGGLIGMMALTFFVILPMLAKIPGTVRETLNQRRFRRTPERTTGSVVNSTQGVDYTSIELTYLGHRQVFRIDNRVLTAPLEPGTELIVFYDPANKSNAYIDVLGSLDQQHTHITQSDTLFKLLEITPRFDVSPQSFELVGELYGGSFDAQKASLVCQFNREELGRFTPGTLLPCIVSGSKDNYTISMVTS